jgi:CheY-like chemotaxis protein
MATVLLVDDEPVAREAMAGLLTDAGCRVFDTFDGVRALDLLDQHPEISILVSDVRMPGMSGIELAAEARKRRSDLRIVLTSGQGLSALSGEVLFLPKPWRSDEVLNILVKKG